MNRLHKFIILFFILPVIGQKIQPDEYHNIQGFYGEKAIGLGGAYTAVSDDPSGLYYNPAGISFAQYNSITANASSYQVGRKTYHDVFGPGQSYTRESKNLTPNFIGVIQKYDRLTVGLSLVNTLSMKYYLSGEINLPYYDQKVLRYKANSIENSTAFLMGPGIGYSLTEKLSIGSTLYYSYDFEDNLFSGTIDKKDGSATQHSAKIRRLTKGVVPVFGLQYLLTDKISLGVSIRRNFTFMHTRTFSSNTLNAEAGAGGYIRNKEFIEANDKFFTALDEPLLIAIQSPKLGKAPELTEVRAGAAYFASQRLLVSGDIIYTGGYKYSRRSTGLVYPGNALLSADNSTINNISRVETFNFAAGAEIFITDNFALRLGFFTNFSNAKNRTKNEMLIARIYSNPFAPLPLPITDSYYYTMKSERSEHIDKFGYSAGFAYANNKTTVSLTFIIEQGTGRGFAFNSVFPQKITEFNSNLYLSAGTNY